MKEWMILFCMASVFAGSACFADTGVLEDDDEYEEVVVRRKKKRPAAEQKVEAPAAPVVATPAVGVVVPAVVAVPVVVPNPVAVPATEEVEEDLPPEPPSEDAAEPRRLVRYFCKAWKDKDYERLWWAMSPKYRKQVSLKKFRKLFESDEETNGGLIDENILETGKTNNGDEGVKVELIFKFPRAKHRFVMAIAERQSGGAFRIVDSPFIPQDLDDL
ncbi:MAG: hypothetical protein K6F50_08495 [Kiritimatiellae bacterium]|nr:hypothetical protein [Kiritimatiellia bacterium]